MASLTRDLATACRVTDTLWMCLCLYHWGMHVVGVLEKPYQQY